MSKHSFRFLKPHAGALDTLEIRGWMKNGSQLVMTVQVSETEVTLEIPDKFDPAGLADVMGAISFLGGTFDRIMDKLLARIVQRFGKLHDGDLQK